MGDTDSSILEFFTLMDEGAEITTLLDLVAPDLLWEFSLPDRTIGGGKTEFAEFLLQRTATPHSGRHRIVSAFSEGSYDLIAGTLEASGTDRGVFFATGRRNDNGVLNTFLLRRTSALPTA